MALMFSPLSNDICMCLYTSWLLKMNLGRTEGTLLIFSITLPIISKATFSTKFGRLLNFLVIYYAQAHQISQVNRNIHSVPPWSSLYSSQAKLYLLSSYQVRSEAPVPS